MKKGFTLVELIVVMAMIGFLSTIVFVRLDTSRNKARDAVRVGDIKSLTQAAETYFSEHYEFPSDIRDLDQYFSGGVPKDPKTKTDYSYVKVTTPNGYCFGAMMEGQGNTTICGAEAIGSGANYQVKGP